MSSNMRWSEYSAFYEARVRKARRHATWTGEFYNRYVSKYVTYLMYRCGCSANMATVMSLVAIQSGMALAIWGTSPVALVMHVVLLQVSGLMDIIDGQIARLRGTSSATGAFLDLVIDRLNVFAVFVGYGWAFHVHRGLSPQQVLLVAIASLGYVYYSELGFIRAEAFPEQSGTMQRFGGTFWTELIKLPYQAIHLNVALLILSVGFVAGYGYETLLAYGAYAWAMCFAQIAFAFIAAGRAAKKPK